MNKSLKLSALALLAAAAASTTNAQTNLLQAVTVSFAVYSQGPTNGVGTGTTNYTVNGPGRFDSKALIQILSSNGFQTGDVLARATPVTNVPVEITNLVADGTIVLVITNESTSEEIVSNYLILGNNTNFIGDTNVTYGSNIEIIGGYTVTLGTNSATYGTNSLIVGTNTTVATSILTNAVGNAVGTSSGFTSYNLEPSASTTNALGTPSWVIYNSNKGKPTITPINTGVYFDIHTDGVYGLTGVPAYVHGEQITRKHVIKFGTTDEIRTLILSNGTWNIKLQGFSHGHSVPVSLGGTDVVYSQDYTWTGDGSGTSTNSTPVVIEGNSITEEYFKFLK